LSAGRSPEEATLEAHRSEVVGGIHSRNSDGGTVSGKDTTICLDRLRDHIADLERGSVDVRRAKLVVLGNGRVGKTQLCRILQGLPYDEKIRPRMGSAFQHPCPDSGTGEQLNLWDFGGQDIYPRYPPRLFMRTRALFVVVWSPDFEQAGGGNAEESGFATYPLSYWLDYVCTLGQAHSPVVGGANPVRPAQARGEALARRCRRFEFLKPCWFKRPRKGAVGQRCWRQFATASPICVSAKACP